MKQLRVQITPDPTVAPRAFDLLANSAEVEETRLLEWNAGEDGRPTMLFTIDGRWEGLTEQLLEDPTVDHATVTGVTEDRAVLVVMLRTEASPMAAAIFEALTSPGLVIVTPVVYRDGTVNATLLGRSAVLQSVLDRFPESVEIDVQEVGSVESSQSAPNLSDRQREAVLTGLELGYYDVPRGTTHREVADRLGCSPSTASEHLQKAEAKLVKATMGEEEP